MGIVLISDCLFNNLTLKHSMSMICLVRDFPVKLEDYEGLGVTNLDFKFAMKLSAGIERSKKTSVCKIYKV